MNNLINFKKIFIYQIEKDQLKNTPYVYNYMKDTKAICLLSTYPRYFNYANWM